MKPFQTQEEVNAQNKRFYVHDFERWQRVGEVPINQFEVDKIRQFFTLCPPGKILDLGTGSGRFLKALIEHAGEREVEGIEIVPEYVEALKQKGLLVREGRAERLSSFESESIAGIFANALVLHFLKDFFKTHVLTEWHRVLKPEGGLYLTYQPGDGESYDRSSLRPLEERRFLSYFTVPEMRGYLEAQKFSIIEEFPIGPFVKDGEQIIWQGILARKS